MVLDYLSGNRGIYIGCYAFIFIHFLFKSLNCCKFEYGFNDNLLHFGFLSDRKVHFQCVLVAQRKEIPIHLTVYVYIPSK